jgi:hypothetical protein
MAVVQWRSMPRPSGARSATRRLLVYGGLAAWGAACVVVGAYLLASHLLTLPTPEAADPALQRAIAAQRHAGQRDRWLVLHVVFDDCGCSQRVLGHLLSTRRPAGIAERVVYVTEHPAEATTAAIPAHGFELDVVTPDQLAADYHIEAAPLLVIVDPHDTVRYAGGYTPRKQAADVRDLAVITAVLRGETVESLPAFGCAVGRSLRSTLDPLGVR